MLRIITWLNCKFFAILELFIPPQWTRNCLKQSKSVGRYTEILTKLLINCWLHCKQTKTIRESDVDSAITFYDSALIIFF